MGWCEEWDIEVEDLKFSFEGQKQKDIVTLSQFLPPILCYLSHFICYITKPYCPPELFLFGLNNRNLFLTVPEAGKAKIRHKWTHFLVRALSLLQVFKVGHNTRRRVSSLVYLPRRALIPLWGLHPHHLITFQRSHLVIPWRCWLGFQRMNCERTQIFTPWPTGKKPASLYINQWF